MARIKCTILKKAYTSNEMTYLAEIEDAPQKHVPLC